jgi:hypothetical protein
MASWSEAFAAQAEADLDTYEWLRKSTVPTSQRLHFLQMWLEKLCKSYLYGGDTRLDEWKNSHNIVAKALPGLILQHCGGTDFAKNLNSASIRKLCREVDLLHPQTKDGERRPDNVEYPWLGGSGDVEVPVRWKFPLADQLASRDGRSFLKAAVWLTRNSTQLSR